jgi:hypothetical protein
MYVQKFWAFCILYGIVGRGDAFLWYTVKKVSNFPFPSRDVTSQTRPKPLLPEIIKLFQARESLVSVSDIPAGDGKIANLYNSVITLEPQQKSDR